jgi:CDGSH-type Zn-finger protein
VCVPKRYVAAMTKITVHDNGPLRIEGDLTICDASGKEFGLAGRHAVSLCRCGLSDNKPFCDGKHARQGWQSACEATDLPPPKQR